MLMNISYVLCQSVKYNVACIYIYIYIIDCPSIITNLRTNNYDKRIREKKRTKKKKNIYFKSLVLSARS